MASREQRKKVNKLFVYIAIGWALLDLVYFIFRAKIEGFLDHAFTHDFAIGFSSAFLENLVFYLFGLPIAYFSIYFSFNDPKDSTFETRVKALANSEKIKMDDELYGYLKRHFTNFLAFTKKLTVIIEIKDYNKEKNAYYIYAETKSIIANMCKDNDFETTETRARIYPDVEVDGDWGTLIRLETFNPENGEVITPYFNFEKITKKFDENIKIGIPKNEELGWYFEYIIWSRTGEDQEQTENWYFVQGQRYTRTVEVVVKNKLQDRQSLRFEARYSKFDENNVTSTSTSAYITPLIKGCELPYDETKRFEYKLGLYPKDKIEFYFYEPKKGDHENT